MVSPVDESVRMSGDELDEWSKSSLTDKAGSGGPSLLFPEHSEMLVDGAMVRLDEETFRCSALCFEDDDYVQYAFFEDSGDIIAREVHYRPFNAAGSDQLETTVFSAFCGALLLGFSTLEFTSGVGVVAGAIFAILGIVGIIPFAQWALTSDRGSTRVLEEDGISLKSRQVVEEYWRLDPSGEPDSEAAARKFYTLLLLVLHYEEARTGKSDAAVLTGRNASDDPIKQVFASDFRGLYERLHDQNRERLQDLRRERIEVHR